LDGDLVITCFLGP